MTWSFFIDIIDTLSPLVTLGFGIFCALNDTKPKNGRLSNAGKVALWGLIVSGLITLLVKGGELHNKVKDREAKLLEKDSLIRVQEKQRIEKAFADSINSVFQKATSDSLSRSISELNTLRSASTTTIHSLDVVTAKQQATLFSTRRGLNPLFPVKIGIDYSVDLNKLYQTNSSHNFFQKEIDQYLDTLVHFASIEAFKRRHRYDWRELLDTAIIPKINIIDPFETFLPIDIKERYRDVRSHLSLYFFTIRFGIHLRKQGEKPIGSDDQITLQFDMLESLSRIEAGQGYGIMNSTIDMNDKILHVQILAESPVISPSRFTDDFISLYDLQNAIIGFRNENNETNKPPIFKLNQILIYTGYDFSRKTSLTFTADHIKEICCNEIYARKIKQEEIK